MKYLFLFLASLTLLSCSQIDDLNHRIDELEIRVSNLEDALSALKTAYNDSKVIKSLTAHEKGYLVSFTDNTSIDIQSTTQTIIPMLLIDKDGYWNISYDNGETYVRLMDNEGKLIKAIGEKGININITTNKDNFYTLELYYINKQDVIDILTTPVKRNISSIISAFILDDMKNTITVSMFNGDSFIFNKEFTTPSSIAILNTEQLFIGKGDTVSFEFRVNPSNAIFNYDVNSDSCNIYLDKVSEARSYITHPTNYTLVKVEQVYDKQGVMKNGQYRAFIADLELDSLYNDLIFSYINK